METENQAQESLMHKIKELEQFLGTNLEETLAVLEKNKGKIKFNLELYYNEKRDLKDCHEYYHSLIKRENTADHLFLAYHELVNRTHKHHVPYFISKDEYLYTWVDMQPNGSIKNIYSGIHKDPKECIEEDFAIIQQRHREFRQLLHHQYDIKGKTSKIESSLKLNAEHIVPQSWYGAKEPMKGDLHHLFACQPECNIKRGNLPYDDFPFYTPESPTEQIQNHCGVTTDGRFEPEYGKGPVARAMLYFLLRYPKAIKHSFQRQIDINILLKWHQQFEVTLYEKHRNQAIYQIQGNRNPFIDYPELAEKIF